MILNEEKVFKDPIHQYIYVNDRLIWDLINTREFQRLRRIKQLGTSYITYHGAEHSRFSHSLGVYEITRKVLLQFDRNNYDFCTKEEQLLTLVAALLHDIGHGPFSHTSEKIFGFNHEAWTQKIILGETEINFLLRQVDKEFPSMVVDILNKGYNNDLIVNLISGQLDTDRMDYLLRDAYYTGVNYGTFDLERILRVLRPFNNNLVVKESGMHSIEDYLMSRYQMYWQVYYHPVTRSAEIILNKIFIRAKYLYKNDYNFSNIFKTVSDLFVENIDLNNYLMLDDDLLITSIKLWANEKDPILADLSSRFLNRRLFKYTEFKSDNELAVLMIREFLLKKGIDPEYYLEIDLPLDSPYDIYHPEEGSNRTPIYLLSNKNEINEISDKSDIIKSLTEKKAITINRIFYPLDLINKKGIEVQFNKLVEESRY